MKIALADDQPLDLKFLMEYLVSIKHEIIFSANDGEELLKKCMEFEFDFLITDLYMPKLSLLDSMSDILQSKPHITIIVVSNNSSNFVKNKLLKFKNVHYITKYKENYFEEIGVLLSTNTAKFSKGKINLLLTAKEKVIFQALLTSNSTLEICNELNLSKKNLERYKTAIYSKLDVKSRQKLISQFIHLLYSN